MPRFALKIPPKSHHPYHYLLDDFAKGYVEAMFFTNCDASDDDCRDLASRLGVSPEDLANRLGVERLTTMSVKAIARDCKAFLAHVMTDGASVKCWLSRAEDYTEAEAGRDFWFTRQGHGTGYWDRGPINEIDPCDELTEACAKFGQVYPQIETGWIYYR